MSKAVLISIRPQWVEKIANGEKTIEVRKTRPNLPTPFKCYIYCTLPRYPHEDYICPEPPAPAFYGGGMVIGEFICDRVAVITYDGGELACTTNAAFSPASCLSRAEIIEYIGDGGRGYGWSISDLRIYDKMRQLEEFRRPCDRDDAVRYVKRPPQSWMYVEEMKNE
nr:MAG TPA: hypothetical protein [Caudoviricetes sp.]